MSIIFKLEAQNLYVSTNIHKSEVGGQPVHCLKYRSTGKHRPSCQMFRFHYIVALLVAIMLKLTRRGTNNRNNC